MRTRMIFFLNFLILNESNCLIYKSVSYNINRFGFFQTILCRHMEKINLKHVVKSFIVMEIRYNTLIILFTM